MTDYRTTTEEATNPNDFLGFVPSLGTKNRSLFRNNKCLFTTDKCHFRKNKCHFSSNKSHFSSNKCHFREVPGLGTNDKR